MRAWDVLFAATRGLGCWHNVVSRDPVDEERGTRTDMLPGGRLRRVPHHDADLRKPAAAR
jgi:hypothetical protein